MVDYSFSETDDDVSEETVEAPINTSCSQLRTVEFTDNVSECQEIPQLLPVMRGMILGGTRQPWNEVTIDCIVPTLSNISARQHVINNVQDFPVYESQDEGFLKREELTDETITGGVGELINCATADYAGKIVSCVQKGRNIVTTYQDLDSPETREKKLLAKGLSYMDQSAQQHRSEGYPIDTTPKKETSGSSFCKTSINMGYQIDRFTSIFEQIQDEFNKLVKENATCLAWESKFRKKGHMNLQKGSLNEVS